MNLFFRIAIGLVVAGIGAYFVIRTTSVIGIFGTVDWAEEKMGMGGTHLFYKLLGIVFILIGFIVATNMWDAFLQATVGSVIPSSEPTGPAAGIKTITE